MRNPFEGKKINENKPSFNFFEKKKSFTLEEPLLNENAEQYLTRLNHEHESKNLLGKLKYDNPEYKELLFNLLGSLLSNDEIPQSQDKKAEIIKLISSRLVVVDVPREHINGGKIKYFEKTKQDRNFFEPSKSRFFENKDVSYVTELFAVPEMFLKSSESKKYIESLINGKTIFLFGGGDSVQDLFQSKTFNPKMVINFDPFIGKESIGKNDNISYKSLTISAADEKLIEMNMCQEIPKADEIWALFSVPLYLKTSTEIKSFFKNIYSLLAEGGNARISPVSFRGLNQDFMDAMNEICNDPKFNVSCFHDTIKIHKLKSKS